MLILVIIYLTDREVRVFCGLRRDSFGSLCFRSLRRFFRFARWARRFGNALHQRRESLRSASAFVRITRQAHKRFFAGFGFLHKSVSGSVVRVVVFLTILVFALLNPVAIAKGCPVATVENIGIANTAKHEQGLVISNVVDLFLAKGRTLQRFSGRLISAVRSQCHHARLAFWRESRNGAEVRKRILPDNFDQYLELSIPGECLSSILKLDVSNEGFPDFQLALCAPEVATHAR